MTREEAQIIVGNMPIKPEVLDDCYDITEYQEAKAMAIKALEQTRWIPISEKLPKVDEEVFISFGHGSPLEIGKYNGKQWEYLYESGADYWTEPLFEVKAWMPLPDRYKE